MLHIYMPYVACCKDCGFALVVHYIRVHRHGHISDAFISLLIVFMNSSNFWYNFLDPNRT